MQTLASDLSGLLSEEQDSQLLLLQLPCKEKEKWTMEKRRRRKEMIGDSFRRAIAAGRCSEIKAGDHPSGLAFRSLVTFVEGVVRNRQREGWSRHKLNSGLELTCEDRSLAVRQKMRRKDHAHTG